MTETTSIHRLLDEAFRGVEMTPAAQDLKEEVRGNLVARVAELEAGGTSPADAAHQAIYELGDVSELLEAPATGAPAAAESFEALQQRYRVRPRPGFVVRVLVWVLLMALAVVIVVLTATGVLPIPGPALLAPVGWFALGLAFLVGDALSQETTVHHPMPLNRAGGFFWATLLLAAALGTGAIVALGAVPPWSLAIAGAGAVGAAFLYAYLGATTTNRTKAWVRRAQGAAPRSRFEEEPETAARFGIYTVVIWMVTFGVIAALVFTVGWWWAPVAFAGGFAVMMLLVARMGFGSRTS